jgi:alkanesulfonate monooxygenase SsuD/methylene tetrahydromethanopterin reductase-like flavin-dependent oxidoreductase (luciferase family)
MLRVAGEAADGVYLWLVGEEATRDSIREVRQAAERAGRTASDVTIGCLIPTCLDDDGEAARWAARRTLVDFYLGRAAYADVLARAGFADVGERVHERVAAGKPLEAAAAIPDEALDQIAVAGTPDACREALGRWTARGIEAPVLYVFPADGAWAPAYRRAITELSPER